jgi:hypothetical protein
MTSKILNSQTETANQLKKRFDSFISLIEKYRETEENGYFFKNKGTDEDYVIDESLEITEDYESLTDDKLKNEVIKYFHNIFDSYKIKNGLDRDIYIDNYFDWC